MDVRKLIYGNTHTLLININKGPEIVDQQGLSGRRIGRMMSGGGDAGLMAGAATTCRMARASSTAMGSCGSSSATHRHVFSEYFCFLFFF